MHRKPTLRDRYGAPVAAAAAVLMIVLTAMFGSASSDATGKVPTGPEPVELVSARTLSSGRPAAVAVTRAQAQVIAKRIGRSVAEVEAASTGDNGCRLSQNWWVPASFNWSGQNWAYGVLSSGSPLRVGGSPDGNWSEYFLFRDDDRTHDGVYQSRDTTKPGNVYRTQVVPGQTAGQDIDHVVQVAMAPSRIFCLATRDR